MAFFKFRKAVDPAADMQPAQSADVLRKRARHRLLGAVVLVLTAVVVFPLLVDKQPRPVAVDLPIEIPDKNKVKPLETERAAPAPVADPVPQPESRPVAAAPAVAPVESVVKPTAPAAEVPETTPADATPASADRFIVQFGAFAEADKAREARLKVESTGLKTYTHVIETKDGRRIRTRVGPFASRAEAEQAAEKIKKLDLPVSILKL
jgi:DedD protein